MPTVRVISDDGEQLGIMAVEKALSLARERELDLIEVSPKANPPVCKIIDYGKYLYKMQKIAQKQKTAQKQTEVKGIRIGFRTSDHDIGIKLNQAKKFLEKRHSVKVQMLFKGREMAYMNLGKEKMVKFIADLKDIAKFDGEPKRHGHTLIIVLNPL